MGELLMSEPSSQPEKGMPATLLKTVATEPSQLAHFATALRQCASLVSPFRGNQQTGALLRSGLLARNQSVADRPSVAPKVQLENFHRRMQ